MSSNLNILNGDKLVRIGGGGSWQTTLLTTSVAENDSFRIKITSINGLHNFMVGLCPAGMAYIHYPGQVANSVGFYDYVD